MTLPKTYKGFIKLLIQISKHGNDYEDKGHTKLTHDELMHIGGIIADIQNGIGEAESVVDKLNLSEFKNKV